MAAVLGSAVVHPWDYATWLTNATRALNATFPHANPLPEGWATPAARQTGLGIQDLPLGLIALLALRKGSGYPVSHLVNKYYVNLVSVIVIHVVKALVGIILTCVALPLVVPFVAACWLASCIAKGIYRHRYGTAVTKVQGMDGVWGMETSESRPFITICLLLAGKPDVARIRQHVSDRILDVMVTTPQGRDYKYKKFRQVFSRRCGYYCWQDTNDFHVDNHVRLISLKDVYQGPDNRTNEGFKDIINMNEGMIKYTNEEYKDINEECSKDMKEGYKNMNQDNKDRSDEMDLLLQRFVSEEGGTALGTNRPPWEMILLARDDDRYNVVVRLHHSIGDGVALVRLCAEALVDTPIAIAPPTAMTSHSTLAKLALGAWSFVMAPLGLLQVVANFDRNCLHGCTLSGNKVMAFSSGLPLDVLRRVKLSAGATVNDVLMSCLSQALATHFSRRGERVPKVSAVVPVSFHDLQAPLTLANCFSAAVMKLPTAPALTPLARLAHTKRMLDALKRDPSLPAVFRVVACVGEVLPAPLAERLLTGRGVSVAASNVPGPQQEMSVWGDRVEDMTFWVPNRAPVGVGVSFSSYMGVVRASLNIDEALVKNREEALQILRDLEAEVWALHRLTA